MGFNDASRTADRVVTSSPRAFERYRASQSHILRTAFRLICRVTSIPFLFEQPQPSLDLSGWHSIKQLQRPRKG